MRASYASTAAPLLAVFALAAFGLAEAAPAPNPQGAADRPQVVQTTFRSVDATVAAQWEFPSQTPAPLVVLLPGGGRMDRNGWMPGMGEDPARGIYAQLAKRLVESGFAVFRYDKPGAGRSSPGQFATERSNALEAYTHAIEHPRVDPERVFLLGHGLGTDTIAAIYPRFAAIARRAGAILLDNAVGESDGVRIEAPTLIVNPGKDPDDRFQYGEFVADARKKSETHKLETEVVLLDDAKPGLLATNETGNDVYYTLDSRATEAVVRWLMQHRG
jgi:pimeloyl-ACP methyl ester carboxylesterase